MSNKTEAGKRDDAEAMAKTAENSVDSTGTGEMSDNDLEGVAGGIGVVRPLPRPGGGGVRPAIPKPTLPKPPKRFGF